MSAIRSVAVADLAPGSRVLLGGGGDGGAVHEVLVDEITRTSSGVTVLVFPPGRTEGRRIRMELDPGAYLNRGPSSVEAQAILDALEAQITMSPEIKVLPISMSMTSPGFLQCYVGEWIVSIEA